MAGKGDIIILWKKIVKENWRVSQKSTTKNTMQTCEIQKQSTTKKQLTKHNIQTNTESWWKRVNPDALEKYAVPPYCNTPVVSLIVKSGGSR